MTGFRLCYRSCLGARMTQISLKQPDRRAALQRLLSLTPNGLMTTTPLEPALQARAGATSSTKCASTPKQKNANKVGCSFPQPSFLFMDGKILQCLRAHVVNVKTS